MASVSAAVSATNPALPRTHGGPDAQGAARHDFSTNSNACGPCPAALVAVQQADATRYPDASYTRLRASLAEFVLAGVRSVPAMMTPFIIVGGILLGWFTPTESAAVAVLYALALTAFVYREMDLKRLVEALSETGRLSAIALFCVGTASAFGWLLAYYQIPKALL